MIDTLNIGKFIYNTLSGDSSINCKVYPLVADNDAKFPFIIYRRANLDSATSKDGVFEDNVDVEITVVSDKYSVGVELASQIRNDFEKMSVIYDNMEIMDGDLNLATEEYSNNAYVQRMNFNFKVKNNFIE